MINVLVAEDSPVVRAFLVHILGAGPGIRVVGTADNGEDAIEAVRRFRPDVVTMDIHMPKMDGLEATRRIMETCPTPIVIVSGSIEPDEGVTTFRAIEAGALAVLRRPAGIGHPDHEADAKELLQTVKLMAEVKVVRRWPRVRDSVMPAAAKAESGGAQKISAIAIGASTGGPPVLQTILSALPGDLPVPVLIVQHMAAGFTEAFSGWLAQSSALPVCVARHGEGLAAGRVYVAPDGFQMEVCAGRIVLVPEEMENGSCPSVARLFRSLAEAYGSRVVAGLLSGMGRDGAEELRLLREKGAITFVQDRDSSVVYGMPGEAVRLDAAMLVLTPDKMAAVLSDCARNGRNREVRT